MEKSSWTTNKTWKHCNARNLKVSENKKGKEKRTKVSRIKKKKIVLLKYIIWFGGIWLHSLPQISFLQNNSSFF